MEIKLIDLSINAREYSATFVAEIDGVKLEGLVGNVERNPNQHDKFMLSPKPWISSNVIYNHSNGKYNLRLRFANSGVAKHPEYKKIRRTLLIEIIKKAGDRKHIADNTFLLGVGI